MAKRRTREVVNPIRADLLDKVRKPPPRTKATAKKQGKQKGKEKGRPPEKRSYHTLRVRIPSSEYKQMAEATESIDRLTGRSALSESEITRALWSLLKHAEEHMAAIKTKAPRLVRPANANWMAKAAYEDDLAAFLLLAMKKIVPNEK